MMKVEKMKDVVPLEDSIVSSLSLKKMQSVFF